MPLSDEQRAAVVNEVVRIVRSGKRAELLTGLRERLRAEGARAGEGAARELDEIVLAVAEAVSELMDGDAPR